MKKVFTIEAMRTITLGNNKKNIFLEFAKRMLLTLKQIYSIGMAGKLR